MKSKFSLCSFELCGKNSVIEINDQSVLYCFVSVVGLFSSFLIYVKSKDIQLFAAYNNNVWKIDQQNLSTFVEKKNGIWITIFF